MATLLTDRSGNFLVKFRYGRRDNGKLAEFTKSANTRDRAVAEAAAGLVNDTIMRLKRGWLVIPGGADPGEFIMSGGKRSQKPKAIAEPKPPKALTLGELFKLYDENFPVGAKAGTTLETEGFHKNHLLRVLTPDIQVETMTLAEIQRYANRRSQETWRGKPTLPPTILKELATLRIIWNWARKQGHVQATVPYQDKDLNFARTEQRPPFQTFEAIQKAIRRGRLSDDEKGTLWECLYLTLDEVHEVLKFVRDHAKHPFIHPMIAFAALTGARRSEICRSRIEDWDLENGMVNIREMKRKRGRTTFRTVDVNSTLSDVMGEWLADHPGGQHTICKDGEPLTVKMATDHFKRTLAGSRWAVIPGFHTFRHSFASILAASGEVDDSMIDRWMGHQTQEQRERYRHLFPKNRRRAIEVLSLSTRA